MKKIKRYLLFVYVVPSSYGSVLDAVKSVTDLRYGDYKWVYWTSAEGIERYNVLPSSGKQADESKTFSNEVLKVEFSIPYNEELLDTLLKEILEVHPWDEPVIRIQEVWETRSKDGNE